MFDKQPSNYDFYKPILDHKSGKSPELVDKHFQQYYRTLETINRPLSLLFEPFLRIPGLLDGR